MAVVWASAAVKETTTQQSANADERGRVLVDVDAVVVDQKRLYQE